MMHVTEGAFITRSELHTESRRGNSKKKNAETMIVEEQMRNKLPMNKFRLPIRRTFLIINALTFPKRFIGRNKGAKRSQNGASWSLINVCKDTGLQ